MKKFFLILMALAMGMMNLAVAEDALFSDPVILSGFVLDVTDETILIQADGMMVEVHMNEETVLTGSDIAVGDLIHVTYNGMMTRSLPAQITAMAIGNYKLMGVVSELTEEGFTLTMGDDVYYVNSDGSQSGLIRNGMFITVYHNGMMTRSIPAQVTAAHIRGQEIIGTVIEMIEGGFTMMVEGSDVIHQVTIKENALQFVTPEPGVELIVITDGLLGASRDIIFNNAVELLPLATAAELHDLSGTVVEITDEYILITDANGIEYQINLFEETLFEGKEIAIGDFIHVTHNGQMTMSLPAQIGALKIGCYAFRGVVSEVTEGQFILTTETEVLLVNAAAEQIAEVKDGATVVVYCDGAMTMSLPAQIGAELIVQLSR